MIKINGKEFRNPQEQLAYNTEEIEKLKETIKDAYKTSSTLTSSSVSDTRANTNVPEGVKSAWLMTSDGLLFKITGNDGTTLLLTYYSDLKGPQGEAGAAVSIDDNSTSNSKTWSSYKINSAMQSDLNYAMLNYTIFYTSTEPTLNGDYYEIEKDDILNPQGLSNIQYAAKALIYLNSSNEPERIYSIKDMSETSPYTIRLVYRGTFKGKSLFVHNIRLYSSNTFIDCYVRIINSSETQFDKAALRSWLNTNHFVYNNTPTDSNFYQATGAKTTGGGNPTYSIYGIARIYGDDTAFKVRTGAPTNFGSWEISLSEVDISDTVISL